MKNTILRKSLMLSFFSMLLSFTIMAQEAQKAPASPAQVATGEIDGASVTINYSSPGVKGRTIWGGLVPYGKIWRAGANAATVIEISKPLAIKGKTLPAGKYSIYAIPGESEWKIIFNSQTGQGGINHDGTTTDDASKDVVVVTVKPKKSSEMNERLVYKITDNGFELSWDNLTVPVLFK